MGTSDTAVSAHRFRHILCVYPYRRELNHSGFYPPLGLEFIAATLKPFAERIEIFDLRREPGRTVDFLRPETDLVCFSVNWDRDAEFLREEIRSVPAPIPVWIGGRHATEDPGRWLTECPNVTLVARGDGEEIVEDLCRDLPLEQVNGISFRHNGGVHHNPVRILGPLRDDLYPDRTLRRQRYEVGIEDLPTGWEIDTVSSSRGCPFNCTFCSFSRNPWGTKRGWSARSPESVVKELSEISASLVGFTDDLFTHDMDRVERICDLLIAKGIKKKYIINARLEIAKRPDILKKMEAAGFAALFLGIESTQDRTLKSMRKGFDIARIREYFQVLKKSSMFLHGYFIIGNIGETEEEMLSIPKFAKELGVDSLGLSALRVSPYSGLEELVAQNPGYHVARNGRIYSDQLSVQKLRKIRRTIYRRYYTAGHFLRLVRKSLRNGTFWFLPGLLPYAPRILWQGMKHWRKRSKRHASREDRTAVRE